jgi:hypothetical protein
MYAVVKNGVITQTFEAIPHRFESTFGFPLMAEAERKARGFYTCVDQRPALADGETYGDSEFTFDGSNVNWTAPVVPASAAHVDAVAAREYGPLQALAAMTPQQVQTYIQNNVTDLASAKTAIKTLAVAVGILARRL